MDTQKSYAVDNSAILYFSQIQKHHTNVYRFAVTMNEAVCRQTLQQALDRICGRFPTIFSGFRRKFFSYEVVPLTRAPRVISDPGLLLTMPPEEMDRSAIRFFCSGDRIILEAFHALTDGYGAMMVLRALIAEYLHLRHGVLSEERQTLLESSAPDWEEELRDSYLDYCAEKSGSMANRYACQLPGKNRDWRVKDTLEKIPTRDLLAAAKRRGVSPTALLSGILSEAIMEIQKKHTPAGKEKPVRIMVPLDLRRLFPSRTLRNFILYALTTMEPGEEQLPREERLRGCHEQLRRQIAREPLAAQITRNVRLQSLLPYRLLPRSIKCGLMNLIYRFFGECNSSITLTNLGLFTLSEQLQPYVKGVDVLLTPRRQCPYNCALISCGDMTSISITRFGAEPELEPVFFSKLRSEIMV